jgi:lipoate-protein ligase A
MPVLFTGCLSRPHAALGRDEHGNRRSAARTRYDSANSFLSLAVLCSLIWILWPIYRYRSVSIYEKIHQALCDALSETGWRAVIAGVVDSDPGSATVATRTGISDAGYSCFANPVRADVMIDGRKIAGAAQRRTRRGLLQQGSIQGIDLQSDLAQRFARELSTGRSERKVDEKILNRARELAEQKYGSESWLRKR